MADSTTPFPPRPPLRLGAGALDPNLCEEAGDGAPGLCHARLREAARRWYELRPRYARKLRGAEVCAAWTAFEDAVLELSPDADFDFGDLPEG
jgi:hypothetical protein